MKHRKRISALMTLWFIGGLLLAACGGQSAAQEPTENPQTNFTSAGRVSATGEVVPARWSTLSMAANGIVEEILVTEGQGVAAGQALARLKGREKFEAALSAAKLELVSAQQAQKDLYENLEASRAAAQARLAAAKDELDKAEERRESQAYQRGDREQIDQAWANYILAQRAVDDAEEDFSYVADRPEDDPDRAYMLAKLAATRQARDRAVANFNYLVELPDEIEVDKIEARVAVARAEVLLAQKEVDKLKDGPNPDQLALVKTRLENAEKQVEAARIALEDLELKAPFSGTISKVYIRQNEWINPGQPAILLADLSKLQVETTDLSEIDVAQVEVGNPATITFDALPDILAEGVVTKIAPKSSEGSGVNYTVTLEFDEIPTGLRWGMTAFVDIEIGQQVQK
ncbi:MAG: HlyD family efflux transporter periplasmic adaptor subunit [Anaerolineae bacterium]|nr:HlyD family efflux transporter periplasmic adaptor subunit [Anaerolineae bacterium]